MRLYAVEWMVETLRSQPQAVQAAGFWVRAGVYPSGPLHPETWILAESPSSPSEGCTTAGVGAGCCESANGLWASAPAVQG